MSKDDKKEIKDAVRFFYDKLDRYYHIIELEGFEFIIDVKLNKIEAENNQILTLLMRFKHKRKNNKSNRIITYKKDGSRIKFQQDGKLKDQDDEAGIEELFLKGREKAIKEIYKRLFKDKINPIF